MARKRKSKPRPRARKVIWLIAAFKLLKGVILIAVGIGALSLLHENVAAQVSHWITALGVDAHNHYLNKLIRKLWTVDDAKLKAISVGTFFYAALMLTEGIGLALRKRWAEYFTIFATSSFLPLEIYELIKGFTITKIVVIAINIAVVVYLALELRRHD